MGESGCGKSITASAVLGLLPPGGRIVAGSIRFDGTELATTKPETVRRLRGRQVAMIAQDPVASLDAVFTVGSQLGELIRRHHGGSRAAVRSRMLELLADVSLTDPERIARRYPHELSGGMAQRVAIAMALAGDPKLLIADEPTTALDMTVQAEILALLRHLKTTRRMAILLITHNWGVVAETCQRAYVMYAGHVVESCHTTEMIHHPLHPYTAGLLGSTPRRSAPGEKLNAIPGTVPPPGAWPSGCHFAPRCEFATPECRDGVIPMLEPRPGHHTRCINHADLVKAGGEHDRATARGR